MPLLDKFLLHKPSSPASSGHPLQRINRTIIATLLILSSAPLSAQIDAGTIVPHRYLVVYRNATIPGDAAVRIQSAGARLLQRNETFGVATAQSAASDQDDATTMRQLAAQPNVEYVVHDRIISAHRILVKPILQPSFSVTINGKKPSGVHPIGPAHGPNPPPQAPTLSTQPTPPTPHDPYDTYYTNSPQGWAVRQVGGYGNNVAGGPAHGPWDTTMGKGVRIAILDSGVDSTHPDLAPNLALNLSEIDRNAMASPCDDGSPQDQEGHGTWTASLAAAAMGPGTGQVIGVAPAATLLNIKVLERIPAAVSGASSAQQCTAGQAAGLLSWVIQGMEDAITNRADIISMSLGITVDLTTGDGAGLKAAFDRVTYAATQAGIVVVAAAGNDAFDLENPRYMELPAQARGVLAIVASTNPACSQNTTTGATCNPGPITLAYYSNYGAPLNALAAPGGSYPDGSDLGVSGWVRGACSSGKPSTTDGPPTDAAHSYGCFNLGHAQYVQAIGTSASAPLAAGVAALLRAAHPTWSATDTIAAMRSSAVPAPGLPVPQINAATALAVP